MKKVMAIMLAIVMCVGVVATGVCASAGQTKDEFDVFECVYCHQKILINKTKNEVCLVAGYRCEHMRDDDTEYFGADSKYIIN